MGRSASVAVPRALAAHVDCYGSLKPISALGPSGPRAARAFPLLTMIDNAPAFESLRQGRPVNRFEVRSVTGASYTLVEEVDRDGMTGQPRRCYRTAYAGLPVIANDDGSFTIVDTHTRLVRVSAR
jgi:hypothetical protein